LRRWVTVTRDNPVASNRLEREVADRVAINERISAELAKVAVVEADALLFATAAHVPWSAVEKA
jgi:hypothetical protein